MNWKTIICLAVIGLLAVGCGRKGTTRLKEGDYEQFFGKKRPAPEDRSVRLSAHTTVLYFSPGGPVELSVLIENASDRARSLPIGLESNAGFSYAYFSALVRDEAGNIEHVTFPADEGELVSVDLDPRGFTTEMIPLSDIYDFELGAYEVVLFYSFEAGAPPDGQKPDWSGKVWTSPIVVKIE